jgi:hypothetical protein
MLRKMYIAATAVTAAAAMAVIFYIQNSSFTAETSSSGIAPRGAYDQGAALLAQPITDGPGGNIVLAGSTAAHSSAARDRAIVGSIAAHGSAAQYSRTRWHRAHTGSRAALSSAAQHSTRRLALVELEAAHCSAAHCGGDVRLYALSQPTMYFGQK